MAKKRLMTPKDVSRIKSATYKKEGGKISKDSYVAKIESIVTKRTKK